MVTVLSRPEAVHQPATTAPARSHISTGHRLLALARTHRAQLYSRSEFHGRALHVPAQYWLETFVPALRARISAAISDRVTATIKRAAKNRAQYGVARTSTAEVLAEALFDNWWYKPREDFLSRRALRDQLAAVVADGEPVELVLPVFSRKPISPLKNRGPLPDLAELHSLARCAEIAQVLNLISPTGCRLTVLSDGRKYGRACRTPAQVIAEYQRALGFWAARLGISEVVRIVDYEDWVGEDHAPSFVVAREAQYAATCAELRARYAAGFDPHDAASSLSAIEHIDEVGAQLAFTFRSIVSSVYYESLFERFASPMGDRWYGDDVQRVYADYVATLHRPLGALAAKGEYLPSVGYVGAGEFRALFAAMRDEAWAAATRYVAISLTDRTLGTVRTIAPRAVKLTIHAKPSELHVILATHRHAAMTAQHCVGGIDDDARRAQISFRYRIEREARGEVPVLVGDLPDGTRGDRFGPLAAMHATAQPIAYVPAADYDLLSAHQRLARKD